jgi:hypothetical protein
VGFDDREPPGVDGAAAVVGVVAALVVVVVVLEPDAAVVVVVAAPAAAVVVVLLVPEVVVVVDAEDCLFVSDDFLEADGVDEPQAAAISPAATTTPAILSELPLWRRARPGVAAMSLLLGTVVALVPLVCLRMVRGPPGSPLRQCPLRGRRFLTKSVNNVKYLDSRRFIVSRGLVYRPGDPAGTRPPKHPEPDQGRRAG